LFDNFSYKGYNKNRVVFALQQKRGNILMANIYDVARYILTKRGRMSTMKLQKLCYYSQAWSLVWDDEPLFNEDFEAWANGPVCRDLYELRKGEFSVCAEQIPSDRLTHKGLKKTQRKNINKVLDYYGDKNAQWLSTLTHMEDPWQTARIGVPSGVRSNNIITKESMAIYYGGL